MRFKRPKHHIEGLVTLLLFGVFAACVLSVLLTGAKVYRDITAENQKEFDQRTLTQFLAIKVRQAQSASSVEVTDNALSFKQELGGARYVTSVYCYDGWLCEIFTLEGWEFDPEDGEQILQLQDLHLSLENGLLTMDVTGVDGKETHMVMSLRGGASV